MPADSLQDPNNYIDDQGLELAKKESIAPRAARYMIKSRNYEMDWSQLIQSEKMKIYHNFYK